MLFDFIELLFNLLEAILTIHEGRKKETNPSVAEILREKKKRKISAKLSS